MSTVGKLLISEIKLKNFTNINKNVDMDVLKAEVQYAQDSDLQTILGSKFYNHLLDGIQQDGTTTWNDDEKILVDDYISKFLIQTAYFQSFPSLMYRTLNRGVQQGNNEFGTPIEIETFKYLRSIQKQRADFYAQRLLDYLLTGKGQNKFPDYNNASTIDGMVPDRVQKYNNGIFLRNSTRKGWSGRNLGINNNNANGTGNIQAYSEQANAWWNCPDCF